MLPTFPEIRQVDLAGFFCAGSDEWMRPGKQAEEIFTANDNFAATSFLYLFRRFGYPIFGWDSHKEVANYHLSTPDEDIILWCSPKSHPRISFGYGYRKAADIYDHLRILWLDDIDDHPLHQRIEHAFRVALAELLRPTFIRDVPYNILGILPDGDPLMQLEEAQPSIQAGYGLGNYDPRTRSFL